MRPVLRLKATVVWELRLKEPIIEFRLLANRNFAIASVLFFLFGFGLFASTTLIPQILQSLTDIARLTQGSSWVRARS